MHVLFAGGTGFVGKTFLDNLSELQSREPFELTLLSRDPDAFIDRNAEFVARYGQNFSIVRQSLPEITLARSFDVIIHGAEVPSSDITDETVARSDEVLKSLLSFAKRSGTKRIVYLSSGAVYSLGGDLDVPFAPTLDFPEVALDASLYGYSKYMSELTLRSFAKRTGIEHVIIRIFNVASRHVPLSGRYALGNFVNDLLDPDKTEITITGSGEDRRSFIGGRELSGLLAYCLNRAPTGKVYNACSQQDISILELAKLVLHVAGSKKPIVVSSPNAPANHYYGVANIPEPYISSHHDIQQEIAQLIASSAKLPGHEPDENSCKS
jgi:nucleoside-diphosphate-sugar epimerase